MDKPHFPECAPYGFPQVADTALQPKDAVDDSLAIEDNLVQDNSLTGAFDLPPEIQNANFLQASEEKETEPAADSNSPTIPVTIHQQPQSQDQSVFEPEDSN